MAKTKNLIYGVYDDGDTLLSAVKTAREASVTIHDCFTPYPVHGLDTAMGIKRSRLPIGAFICGSLGFSSGLSLQIFTSFFDWPMNIGGKPFLHIPTYVPVTFELTILFTAFGIGLLFFGRSKMIHGIREDVIDRRQTDNKLILAIDADEPNTDKEKINELLRSTGATEVNETEYPA